jgi:hypothetical protein
MGEHASLMSTIYLKTRTESTQEIFPVSQDEAAEVMHL